MSSRVIMLTVNSSLEDLVGLSWNDLLGLLPNWQLCHYLNSQPYLTAFSNCYDPGQVLLADILNLNFLGEIINRIWNSTFLPSLIPINGYFFFISSFSYTLQAEETLAWTNYFRKVQTWYYNMKTSYYNTRSWTNVTLCAVSHISLTLVLMYLFYYHCSQVPKYFIEIRDWLNNLTDFSFPLFHQQCVLLHQC